MELLPASCADRRVGLPVSPAAELRHSAEYEVTPTSMGVEIDQFFSAAHRLPIHRKEPNEIRRSMRTRRDCVSRGQRAQRKTVIFPSVRLRG